MTCSLPTLWFSLTLYISRAGGGQASSRRSSGKMSSSSTENLKQSINHWQCTVQCTRELQDLRSRLVRNISNICCWPAWPLLCVGNTTDNSQESFLSLLRSLVILFVNWAHDDRWRGSRCWRGCPAGPPGSCWTRLPPASRVSGLPQERARAEVLPLLLLASLLLPVLLLPLTDSGERNRREDHNVLQLDLYFQECKLLRASGEKCKIENFTEKTTALDFITPLRLLMKGVKNSGNFQSTIFEENDENVLKSIKKIKKEFDEKDIKAAIAFSKKHSIPLEFGCLGFVWSSLQSPA